MYVILETCKEVSSGGVGCIEGDGDDDILENKMGEGKLYIDVVDC